MHPPIKHRGSKPFAIDVGHAVVELTSRNGARTLVRASILAAIPNASPAQMRQQIFMRFYGHEFDSRTLGTILASLDGGSRSGQNAAAAR